MARIRSVLPGQWTDDEFVACSPLTRLLVLGLRNESDDNGIFEWNPVKLKMRLLPADNCDVSALLAEAVSRNQIHRFTIAGKNFGIIRNFHKYQKPKYPSFSYPVPESLPEGYELNKAHSGSTSPIQPEMSIRGSVEESSKTIRASKPDALRGFDLFWKAYPKKKSKGDAKKAWKKINPDEHLQDRILRALERAKTSADWKKDHGQFIPYPASWLNAEGWDDEVEPQRRDIFAGAK